MMWPERIRKITNRLSVVRAGMYYGGIQRLAEKLGVTRQTVHNWLSGKKEPNRFIHSKIQAIETRLERKRGVEK